MIEAAPSRAAFFVEKNRQLEYGIKLVVNFETPWIFVSFFHC